MKKRMRARAKKLALRLSFVALGVVAVIWAYWPVFAR